jgi:hypothetical protein
MRKDEALKLLTQHKPELIRRFGITDLALFGSTVRDEARRDSDLMYWSVLMGLPRRSAILGCSFIWKTCWEARLIW